MPLSALCAKSRDGEEMSKFERTFPHMDARAKQRRFNLDNDLTQDDGGGGANAEGRAIVVLSHRIVSYRIVSNRIVSHHIISYHVVSHHIVTYYTR